jgi:hypothetical protein
LQCIVFLDCCVFSPHRRHTAPQRPQRDTPRWGHFFWAGGRPRPQAVAASQSIKSAESLAHARTHPPPLYRCSRRNAGTSTLVTCAWARSRSGPAARKTKIPLKPPAGVAASGVASASAARGKPGQDLGHHPELDGREDGYRSADDHVDRHRDRPPNTQRRLSGV